MCKQIVRRKRGRVMCLMQFLYAEAWDGKKFLECKDCPIKAECTEYEPKEQTESTATANHFYGREGESK